MVLTAQFFSVQFTTNLRTILFCDAYCTWTSYYWLVLYNCKTQGDFLVIFMDIAKDELAKRPAALSKERLQVRRSESTYYSGKTALVFFVSPHVCLC